MTKSCVTIFLILFGWLSTISARSARPALTKETVRNAIAIFRTEPTSERGFLAKAIIMRFAEESPDVEVKISKEFVPWITYKPYPKHITELVTAYLAGTIRSQIESGKHKNNPVAGAEQVIETYQKVRKLDPGFRDNYAEKLSTLKADGKLRDYIKARDKD